MNTSELIRVALEEDLINDVDLTSDKLIDRSAKVLARLEVREECVVSGMSVATAVFTCVDPDIRVRPEVEDGEEIPPNRVVLRVSGSASTVLRAERTAINFLSHLTGIATHTRSFVRAVAGTSTRILATRKTTPGLRALEIAAVKHGGGDIYRTSLSDSVLVKDNHLSVLDGMAGLKRRIEFLKSERGQDVEQMLQRGKVEVSDLVELELAVSMGWRQILLDNFAPEQVRVAVQQFGHRAVLEVSGGVTLHNVSRFAAAGAPFISIGAITHSSKAVDFSLEIERRLP